jgi:pilus assembly protein CpaE
MLAVHLAIFLVRQHGKKVLLIDHKQQLGHVALYLGLKDTQYHFEELLHNADRLDSELLNGFIVRHRSGLDVIASPELSGTPHEATSHEFERVMDFLRREYDYVLIDSPIAYEASRNALIEQSDEVYIVSTPDVAALRDLARMVEHLSLSDSSTNKLRLVVNRSTASDSVTPEQIEKTVRFPISVAVPNNYFELLRAINDGEPISPQRRSEFNQALSHWANQIVNGINASEPAATKKGLFSFLRS